MSTRLPGTTGAGINSYRQDDERRRDEARASTLQNQVDELRQALRELASRQVRIEEGLKQYEGAAAQNRLSLEQFRQESGQTAQARALDENRTRQIIADLDQRIDDSVRPIRSLQAHVNELLELSRKKTDDTGQHQRRYDELRSLIDHLQAQSDRSSVVAHQLRDSIDTVRGETDQLRRDILRGEDAVKIVDQESRRRVAEVSQTVDQFVARLDELRSDLAHAVTQIEETQRAISHIEPTFDELRSADEQIRQEQTKQLASATERFETQAEREEDRRQSMDAQFAELRNALDQRYERATERVDAVNEQYRELGYRISALAIQLDELRQADSSLRRDLWSLNEQRVRLRLEQAQHELDYVTGSRRQAEQEPEAPRPTQRALDT
jgi:chromosome segregation ATPase